ncbi:D-alanine--poly(phosphoribitol) ligase, subunit 1 [Burkholderia pseudomallei]|nr:D-alanine--poly(phosphoribitol) ligase, subunit 1 [Burkholderia pseudomallei]
MGGAGVARGYLNRPELTRERFIDDPFVAGGRLYKTGDLARWRTDGSLEYLGRNDFQVKIRGFRIELGEIEAQLAKVAGVREVVVLARDSAAEVRDSATEHATPNALSPSPETSTATAAATATATATATEKRLVAYYTGDADVAALRAQAAQHLPSYMVPSAYVRLDAWPLTPNGKLDRRALPAPADDAYARAEYEAPQGAKEEALAAIWRELLHVERVSRHDNFFELGGHSLLAVQLVSRLRREGLHTDVRSIFNAQTLSDLAARAQTDDRSIQAPPNLIPARATRITPDMLPLVALTQTQIDMLAVQVEGGAANIQDIYPLAPLQEGMVFHHLLHAESDAYMEAYFVGFRTRARLDRFLDALRMIVDRHDILRTGFFWEGLEQPVQIVQRRVRLPIEFVDLDPADGDVLRQLEARHDPRAHRLDIRRPALLSCHAAHDPAAGRWLLCVMAHHLAIDNTSLKLLVAEEQAIEQGGFDALPPAPSFRNFIAQIASGIDRREHEAFFSAMLGDIDSPTHPFGLQDVQGDGREIAEFQQRLSPELSKAIRVCTRRLGVSPASLMHLAWAMVLSRATGRREAVFGTVLFGRMQGGERGMGMFINTLPIRIDVDERYVAECLAHTHERVVQLIYHEHAPLALALRCSGLPAQQALFSSLLNYRHSEQAARPPRDDDDIQYLDGNERTNYPLTVSIDDLGEAFSVTVQARHPASPERIRAFMETALEQLVRALDGTSGVAAPGVVMPRIAVCDIDVLPSEERHRLLVEWNDTAADYPQDQCLHRLFEAQAARHPDTIALIADGEPVGYAELNRRANRLARHLSARGLQPDQRVAICIDRGIDMVVAMLAVLKAGGAYVPLDPAYPSERLDYLLRDCAPVALLTHARLGASMQTRLVLALARLDTGCALIDLESDAGAWRHERDDDPPPSGLTPRHLAYVIYTSGSTGQPKGVMVEHRSVCNLVAWHAGAFDVGTGCRSASVAGVAFDATTWEVWAALCNGGCLSLAPGDAASDPQALLRWWRAQELDVGFLVTPLAELAYATGQSNAGMRTLLIGGDRLSRWPDSMPPGQMLVNNYGPTEATVVATSGRLQPGEATPPIGRPIANTRVYVLDAWLRPAPIGVAGELYIGGVQVARGYLNRPELTRERFIDDPFVAGGRLYRTGDLARWRTDGSLEYLGRNDFQVKIRGFRIELGEIEAQLAKVTGVREVVVLARDSAADTDQNADLNASATANSSEKRLVAYYTGDADVTALRAQAAQHLPSYMVPSAYVRLDAWPLTPNGKLDRRALPAPADDAYARAEYEAPQGAKEEALAAIWRELLHVERVSRHDNFFELGGHSLLAIGVIERMRREGLHTDVRSIFNAQTLSDLAARAQTDDRSIQAPPNLIPARATRITPDMLPLVALTQTQIDMLAVQVEGGAANIQDIYPLAPLQEGMVFHHLLHAESDAYMEAYFVGFRTRARLDRFLDALRMIVDRHDILRTGFFWEGLEQPVQIVQRRVRLPIEFVDLDPADGDVLRQLEARHDPRAHRLDIRRPALLSCHAAHDPAAGRWLLCVMAHHLAIDNTSLKLLVAEEQAIEQGGFDALPPAPSFRNFIAQIASGIDRREHEAFFSAMLGDIDSPTHPFGLQDVQGDGREIAEFQQRLSPELSKAIRVCTRRLGVSPASLMHLAWAMVLSRATGRREAVFGTVLFGRMQGGERGMGMFINTLPIRIDVDERYVAECLAHTHERVVQLIYHEHAPLALALRCSGLPAQQALFSSLLNYRHSEQAARPPRDDDDIQYLDGNERTNYPLTVSIDDLGEAFSVTVQARHPASPERIRAFMETALEQLVRALDGTSGVAAPGVVMPRIAVCDIDVLPSEERHRLLVEWNDTAADYPQDQCLHRLFEAQAARHPDTIALIADGEPVGYAELNRRANRLARHLSARGLQPDQRVAICIDRGIDMVVAMLAVLKAGGAYVPLDPAYPSERLDYLLRDCAPVALLTHARLGASMQTRLVLALARLDTGCALIDLESDAGAWRHERDDDPPPSGLTPRHLAYVIYTSGSTGQPKGVMVEHRSVCNLVAWHAGAFDVGTGCRSASVAGVAFDATTWEVWAALCNGGCLSLAPGDAASDPQALLRWWRAQELDVGFLVTPLAELAYATGQSNAGMRTLLIGGDRLSRWPDSMPPGQMLVNNYGPTEATVVATSGRLQPGEATPPIGRPIANTRVYVLDAWLRPAPIGVAGELYIGGVQVARGYLNRPELTRERFIDDPFVAGGRLYKTGDLARWRTDGSLEYLGRNDFQVKIRGFRIELGEIEAQLAKVTGVREVVVLARDSAADTDQNADLNASATANSSEKRLVAYYTGDADVTALRAQAAQHLPSYMVPSAYVRLDAWPLTPNGKLDRRALPAPADDAYARAEYEAPQGAKEEALAAIWRELLHVERVSRHDNFFELGGHSLLAVQLVSRLRQALSVEVALGTVFDAPVLSALAERLEAENTAVLPPIPLTPRDGRIALSLAQQRLWFLTQLEGVSEAYHMSGAVRLDGLLNREVLQRALNRIVMRHEALRTCFAREEGEPIQVIQPHADLTVSYHDLREAESIRHEAGNREQRAKDLSQAHASAPFDLSRDLPVRVLLLQLADEAHVVQVVMHHIASDGWSVGVFLQELSALYGSFIAKQDDPLAPLPLQYADYAAWQRRWLASGQLEKQGAFWQTNLSGAPTLLELPTDRPRPPKQSHAGASVEVKLGAALSERVKRLSQRHGVTPYMTLLSSWAAVLSRLSGQEEVVIGSPVAGRNRTEVEALIGFFVNTLALRLDLSSEPTVGELLKRTKAQVLSAQAHQDLPFDQVVERVKPPRSTAHPPLFQVMFDWHNTPARALTMPGLTVSVARTETTTSQYDLVLSMQERNGDIVGHLNYATALFDEQTARRYARYWRRLLEGMTAGSANVSVARLPLLDEAEREQVVHEWNATERAYPIRQCIHQLFEAQAARTPNAIAIGDERVTYAALNASANRLARHLRALGVVADTRVAVCIERGAPMVIALLAIWKAGGAYVPLDPAYPRERIAYMLRDSAPIAVLTSRASRDLVASHLPDRAPLVVIDAAACPWDALSGDDLDPNDIELNATHLCYVIYTSGSTGQPKGVMIEHRNLVNYTLDAIRWFGLGPGETVLQQNSLNFDLSLEEIVPALSSGAALAPAVELFGAGGSARGHSARPTMIHLTAAHWQQLVGEWHRAGARPAAALEGVRLVNVTGDALSPHKLEQWDAIRPAHTRLINTYGPTEITISCSAAYVRHAPGMSRVSIGRPFANSRMYLLDARGEPVPVGVTGELYIGGDGVARGYLNRPELSAERFVDDPFRPGSRMYKTGDLACRRGDGEIEFVGRNDFQVKVRGFRVELSEVETRLAAVDGVQEIAVLAREDAPGEKRLVAYYTGAAEMAALRECAARDLPAYMMPAAYVCLPALPLTPNGKLDRNALPPPAHDADSNRGYEAPQGDIEETLARIWEQLLERERVGRHDNFFDLGGHSLLTVSLIERMRQADLHADVAALFTTSTLAELAACTTKLKEILL